MVRIWLSTSTHGKKVPLRSGRPAVNLRGKCRVVLTDQRDCKSQQRYISQVPGASVFRRQISFVVVKRGAAVDYRRPRPKNRGGT